MGFYLPIYHCAWWGKKRANLKIGIIFDWIESLLFCLCSRKFVSFLWKNLKKEWNETSQSQNLSDSWMNHNNVSRCYPLRGVIKVKYELRYPFEHCLQYHLVFLLHLNAFNDVIQNLIAKWLMFLASIARHKK